MCTCGNSNPHPIARKTTADNVQIHVWSDGMVTDASIIAGYLPGVGRRKIPTARLWAFADDVCTYAASELGSLVAEHQKRQATIDASRTTERHPDAIVGCGRQLQYGYGFQGTRR